jgi:DNA-binding CsgD family transcriptional regulator
VAVVAGEAGIGKSALVAEFARRCGATARVLWGGCDPLVTPRALGPLHDIGRQIGGVLAALLADGGSQEEIFAAFLNELSGPRQRQRPVIVVEDVHWADEATLDWLALLGRRIARFPALLVITFRDDEVGAGHPLRGNLAALPSAIVRRVSLPPLSPACVAEQARRAGRDAATVHRLAGGNPLLVTELLRADGTGVPTTVQDLILDRLRALPGPAREVAQFVAVIPTLADAAVVAGASELVEVCMDAGVLVPAGDGVSFRHEILRRAVEDSLSPTRHAALHQRALDVLAELPGVDPGRLVHHALHAKDDTAVLRYARVAAAGAAGQGAHREAVAHYRAAAGYADRLPAEQRAALLEAYGFQAYLAGFGDEGLRSRRAALDVRQALGQPVRVGENLRWISRLAWWTGRAAEARDAADLAITVLEAEPPGRQLAMAYSNRSQLHVLAYELDQAVTWGERARRLADQVGDVDTSIHATINVNTARLALGDRDAQAALEEAHERAAAHGLVDHAARALLNLASPLADELMEYAAAAPVADRALDYVTEHDLDGYLNFALGVRAGIRLARCDWDGALIDAEAALAVPVEANTFAASVLLTRGRIQAARGHPDALSTLDEASREASRNGELQWLSPVAAARSEYFLWCGDAGRARDEAHRGLELAMSASHPFHCAELTYRLWRAGATVQVPDPGTHPYHLMINGDWQGAAAEWGRRGAEFARVEALAGGDEAAAGEALRILDRLGATRAAQWLRAELTRRGFRVPRGPRRVTAANAAGLTPRQMDVLALLAEGLSNVDIARRLSLSAKTVDHHTAAVLDKLGAANRVQAAVAAYDLKLVPRPAGGPHPGSGR